jgi:hypothetical protein
MVPCGAEGSDHFGPCLGLIGVVVGLVVSEVFAARRESVRRQHEDKVRFHNERLEAYIAYMAAANRLFGAATLWGNETLERLTRDISNKQERR